MIQFNLLPDVKLEYIKARTMKRTFIAVSVLVAGIMFLAAALLFLGVNVAQKKHLNDLNKDIVSLTKEVQATPDLDRIITVQNQLNSLPGLYDKRPAAKRLFDYLGQVTPSNVTISSVSVDFASSTMTLNGASKNFLGINTFVDTLKFTKFSASGNSDVASPAFSKVVLTSFGTSDAGSSYSISLSYDPALFDGLQDVKLNVPQTITTRSQSGQDSALFQKAPNTKTGAQ